MKRRSLYPRTQVFSELRSGQAARERHPLLEPGTWVIEERETPGAEPVPIVAGLSFGAAHQWISILEREVEKFITDNEQECLDCGIGFILLINDKDIPASLLCPNCGSSMAARA